MGPEGEMLNLIELKTMKIPSEIGSSITNEDSGEAILENIGTGGLVPWNLVLTETTAIPLADKAGMTIETPEGNGLLIGSNGDILSFSNVRKLVISEKTSVSITENDSTSEIIEENLFENKIDDTSEVFKFDYSKEEEQSFTGDESCNVIHINVGYSSYGWNIDFTNGIRMGITDLREYQARHGKLPDTSGVLSRGNSILKFSSVNRIAVYQQPMYYGYGYGNPS